MDIKAISVVWQCPSENICDVFEQECQDFQEKQCNSFTAVSSNFYHYQSLVYSIFQRKQWVFYVNTVTVSLASSKHLIYCIKMFFGLELSTIREWQVCVQVSFFDMQDVLLPKTKLCAVNRLYAVAFLDYLHHITVDFIKRNKNCVTLEILMNITLQY